MPRSNPSSLPSYFNYSSSPPPSAAHHHPFFCALDEDDPQHPVESVTRLPPQTRLEVMKGWEVSLTVLSLYAVSTLAFFYVIFKLKYATYVWNNAHQIPDLLPPEQYLRVLLELSTATVQLFFVLSIALTPSRTVEQYWTAMLMTFGLITANPLTRSANSWRLHTSSSVIDDTVYTAAVYFYLALSAHSYRILDPKRIHSLKFYLPKLAFCALYLVAKTLLSLKSGISLGLIPYSRLLTWFILQQSGRTSLNITIPVILITLLDTSFVLYLMHEVATTSEFLETVPYVETRSKQLGFRCFVFQTLAFCFNTLSLSMLTAFLTPRNYIYEAFDNPKTRVLYLEPPVARLAIALIYCTWTFVIAFVNLPPAPTIPLVQQTWHSVRASFRHTRLAVWLGWADMVTTEDAEDSDASDDGVDTPTVQTVPRKEIPLRYRHREIFDHLPSSPAMHPSTSTAFPRLILHRVSPLRSPIDMHAAYFSHEDMMQRLPPTSAYAAFTAQQGQEQEREQERDSGGGRGGMDIPNAHRRMSNSPLMSELSFPRLSLQESHAASSRDTFSAMSDNRFIYRPARELQALAQGHARFRRLRLRKNLFVMETAIMMANASYLSYIPGNPREERASKRRKPGGLTLHTGSLSTGLQDLARQIEESRDQTQSVDEAQPRVDDGSMFLVDPYEMAERQGYKLYTHIENDALNTHAIVLVSSSRVIVAASGTRDVKNWKSNTNTTRAVLDDKLTRFEYTLSENSQGPDDDYTNQLSLDNFDYMALQERMHHDDASSSVSSGGRIRRSRSDELHYDAGEEDQLLVRARGWRSRPLQFHRAHYGATTIPMEEDEVSYAIDDHSFPPRQRTGVTNFATMFAKELLTFGQAKVHEGFLDAYMSLRKQIMGTLIEIYKGKKATGSQQSTPGIGKSLPLFFCGHSLGGAIATLAAYEAARYYKRIGISRRQDISCTTFGCPRIGNEAFKMRYERLVETHWRFETAADPIPRVSTTFLNYVPVGVQILMDQSGMLLIDPSFIEVQWWGKLANLYLGYRLHTRAAYVMALKTFCRMYKGGTDDLADRFWPFPIRVQTRGLFRIADR